LSCQFLRVEGEVEGGSFADGALGPDAASVTLHDLLHAGQADARAGELADGGQSLEQIGYFQ
jgi:hypothetical protein